MVYKKKKKKKTTFIIFSLYNIYVHLFKKKYAWLLYFEHPPKNHIKVLIFMLSIFPDPQLHLLVPF